MNLKLSYKILAVAIAAYVLAVFASPTVFVALLDPVSVSVNRTNAFVSLYLFAVWALVVLYWLMRHRPQRQDWPHHLPVWLMLAWLLQSVFYTGYEHGWFALPDVVYGEDGIFETLTAIALFYCAFSLARAGIVATRRGEGRLASLVIAMAVLCLVFALEEISWGQRIFGWSTPEPIGELNAQSETNLHKMFVGYNQLIRLVVSLIIASVLIGQAGWFRRLSGLGIEKVLPFAAAVYFVPFLLYAHVYDELFEEVMALFLVVYVFDLNRRIRSGA